MALIMKRADRITICNPLKRTRPRVRAQELEQELRKLLKKPRGLYRLCEYIYCSLFDLIIAVKMLMEIVPNSLDCL